MICQGFISKCLEQALSSNETKSDRVKPTTIYRRCSKQRTIACLCLHWSDMVV